MGYTEKDRCHDPKAKRLCVGCGLMKTVTRVVGGDVMCYGCVPDTWIDQSLEEDADFPGYDPEWEHVCEGEDGANECSACAVRDCPEHEPLHYHHDGCPSCDA